MLSDSTKGEVYQIETRFVNRQETFFLMCRRRSDDIDQQVSLVIFSIHIAVPPEGNQTVEDYSGVG
jgi:hypothetical protein